MAYAKLIEYFESEAGLEALIDDYKSLFDQIDDIGQQLIQGIISNAEDYRNVLNLLTGAYISLQPLYSMSKAHKLNEELKYYVEQKRELEESGKKVIATSLEKESSSSVSNIRRVRNILEGYVAATEKGIVTCQTQLKRLEEDNKYKPQEEV